MTHNNPAVQEIMDTYTPVEVKKLIDRSTDKQFVHHQKPEDIMKFYANHDMYIHHWLLDDTYAFRMYVGLMSAYNQAPTSHLSIAALRMRIFTLRSVHNDVSFSCSFYADFPSVACTESGLQTVSFERSSSRVSIGPIYWRLRAVSTRKLCGSCRGD